MKLRRLAVLAPLAALLALTGCAAYLPSGGGGRIFSSSSSRRPVQGRGAGGTGQFSAVRPGEVDPKIQPYSVNGRTYWPVQSALGFSQVGYASWYGSDFQGKRTATGESYDMYSISAAHKTLPLGSRVRVTNLENGRQVELTINDRGPFVDGRIIDLSYASARLLGMARNGLARVRVEGVADNPVLARQNGGSPAVALAADENGSFRRSRRSVAGGGAFRRRARTATASAAAQGRYMIQVGAFALEENARRVRDHLVRSGYPRARVLREMRGGRPLSVVLAGSFSQREQAETALASLRGEFPGSFIEAGV